MTSLLDERHSRSTRTILPLGWPLGWAWSVIPMAAIAAIVYATNRPDQSEYAEWVTVSASAHECLMSAGPLIAIWAVLRGFMLASRTTVFSSHGRGSRGTQLRRHVGTISLASVAAIAVGLAPSWIWAARTATWGGPSIWDLAIMVGGVAMIAATSFTLGSLLPRAAWLPAVPGLWVLLLMLPGAASRALAVVSPVQHWSSSARFQPNPLTAGYFVLFAALIVATAAVAFRSRHLADARTAVAVGAVAAVVLAAIPFAWRPDLYVLRHRATATCATIAGTTACVHPAHSTSLPMITRTIADINAAAGTPLLSRFTDLDIADTPHGGAGIDVHQVRPSDTTDDIAYSVASTGLGYDVCLLKYPTSTGDSATPADVSTSLIVRVMKEAGYPSSTYLSTDGIDDKLIAKVNHLSVDELHALIRTHLKELQSCSLSPHSI